MRYFLLASLSFLLIGCATTSNISLENLPILTAQIQKAVDSHHSNIKSMLAEGQITIETPEFAQTGSFILKLQKPDSLLINIRGPFGIKVGSALITRKEFLFYNSFENKLITAKPNIDNLTRIFHSRISFDDLINMLGGGTFLEEDLRQPDDAKLIDGKIVFIYSNDEFNHRYWIDKETFSIQKIQFIDFDGNIIYEQIFSNFENLDGLLIPLEIHLTETKNKRKLTIFFNDIDLNKNDLKFNINVPQNAERVHW